MAIQLPSFVNSRTRVRSALYVLVWLGIVLSNAYDTKSNSMIVPDFSISFNTAFWLTVWFEHTVVLNRFLTRQQWFLAVLGSMVAVLVFIVTRYVIEQELYWHLFGISNYPITVSKLYFAYDNLYFGIPAILIGAAFKLIEDWLVYQREREALVSERNQAELAFLKSQVNPHFLFNTLNNIYALTYAKSDAAPGAILKLSELMRYMLYDSATGPDRVSLAKEVTYLKNFIELEKLRLTQAHVEFMVDGNIDLFQIEPMLLVSFVENAFKHGDLTDPNHPLVLDLSVQNGRLRFDTLNKKAIRQTDAVGGIGLANVRRRLQLLYPNRHTLRITDEPGSYACSLELSV
ncbi:sensor histidine kinase [Spirosoma sp. KUDC1026]|uniref:sensor histidine kinase n=1 Tax=Spirosoma sp. KUDC1026 TaxID=2745947 RepID=UPI00159BC837|nr:sensor histidine kinase [Spirosoma sp. KUDC1026]QKZ12461.1 sensor histidine kinase [Spirosoma sp. KUDC1026]